MKRTPYLREGRSLIIQNRFFLDHLEDNEKLQAVPVHKLLEVMRINYEKDYPNVLKDDTEKVKKLLVDLYRAYDDWCIQQDNICKRSNTL